MSHVLHRIGRDPWKCKKMNNLIFFCIFCKIKLFFNYRKTFHDKRLLFIIQRFLWASGKTAMDVLYSCKILIDTISPDLNKLNIPRVPMVWRSSCIMKWNKFANVNFFNSFAILKSLYFKENCNAASFFSWNIHMWVSREHLWNGFFWTSYFVEWK